MKYILDTNAISELIAPQPNQGIIEWIDNQDPAHIFLTVMTIGEIQKGIGKLADSPRKKALTAWLHDDLLVRFDSQIINIDTSVMLTWGELVGKLEQKGLSMSAIDSLIAAIALQGNFALVTRNASDFQHAGVTIISPWQ
jgi:tRNA(fMet)-specific endonuclease VapC